MLSQSTDSGGNNVTMAAELETMFSAADDPADWDATTHHIRCYAHKLNLVVGHGLKALGQKVGTLKPSNPHGISLPMPSLEVNGEEYQDEDDPDSDEEDSAGLPAEADGVDDDDCEEEDEDKSDSSSGETNVVAIALAKVSLEDFISL